MLWKLFFDICGVFNWKRKLSYSVHCRWPYPSIKTKANRPWMKTNLTQCNKKYIHFYFTTEDKSPNRFQVPWEFSNLECKSPLLFLILILTKVRMKFFGTILQISWRFFRLPICPKNPPFCEILHSVMHYY